jgi:hypothetical protein
VLDYMQSSLLPAMLLPAIDETGLDLTLSQARICADKNDARSYNQGHCNAFVFQRDVELGRTEKRPLTPSRVLRGREFTTD